MTTDLRGPEAVFARRRLVGPRLPSLVRRSAVRAALAELAFVGVVYAAYRLGRLVTADAVGVAREHAHRVHDLERALPLPSGAAIQSAIGSTPVFEAANLYYLGFHFPVVIAFLAWGFLARPRAEYRWARNLLVVQTLAAVIIHIVYPLAPPRMFPKWGFIDTMSVYGPSAYDGPSAAVANQYAAMPSLHAGWAILIAFVIARTGPPLLAWLAGAHALLTVAVITVTANHWFVDTAGSVALLGLALLLFPAPGRSRVSFGVFRRASQRRSRVEVQTSTSRSA